MRIPVYQKQNTYQRAYAQRVNLAAPTLESSVSKDWQNVEMLGSGFLRAVQSYKAIEEFAQRQSGANNEQRADEIAAWIEEEKKKRENSAVSPAKYTGFSSPQRARLYEFSQTQAWQQEQAKHGVASSDAVDKLDAYFAQQLQENGAMISSDNPDQNLLVQDYSVIRQEMQHMQQAQAAQVEQETFARSAGQFVQTAGLIRSAGALDKYIQANLAAAEQEIGSQKCKSAQWQEQKKQLQDQAVCHNIEAALYASQVQQAADVYTHFEKTLPRELQESLQDKLQTGQAAASAVELAPGLYESCVSEDGEINIGAASAYLHRYCKQYGGDETKLTQAVKIQLALESKHKLQKKSQAYLDLLACAAAPDGPAESRRLLVAWQGTAQQRKQAEKLAYALEQPSEKKTNAAVFNDLQHQLYAGNLTQQQIDKAFNGGGLSAADALRLKSRCCLAHAGQNDIQDKILFDSVYRFCEKSGLDNKSTQEAVYAVFSSGEDAQTHLKAAEELKKWLVL